MEGRIFGYATSKLNGSKSRSSVDRTVKYATEENIIKEKASGKDLERPGYQALRRALGL